MAFLQITTIFSVLLLASSNANEPKCTEECEEGALNLTTGETGKKVAKKVCHYTIHDQCHAQPDFHRLLINQLLFYIPTDGVCPRRDGHKSGLLICYHGQLGRETPHVGHGQVAEIGHRHGNRVNNPVTKRCEQLRKFYEAECETEKCKWLAQPSGIGKRESSWHGMLLWTDERGDIWVQLSTSKHNFTVPRSEFGEWLSLKLASPKHKISFFSRDIGPFDFAILTINLGPHRSFDEHRDGQELVERQNRINLAHDTKLWKKYAAHWHEGALLKDYAGIWSVGMDMLPTEAQDGDFWLFTERPDSECCELEAWFLTPTAEKPKMGKREYNGFRKYAVKIEEGFTLSFSGRIKQGTKKMVIMCEDKDSRTNHSVFKWEEDYEAKKSHFFMEAPTNGSITKIGFDEKTLLEPGFKLTISITVWKNYMVLNISNNCTKLTNYPIPLNVSFDFDKYYNFEIQGITLHKRPRFHDYSSRPFKLSNRQGFLVRGTIEGGEGFSLYFRQDLGDGEYRLALELTFIHQTSTLTLRRELACKDENGCEKFHKFVEYDAKNYAPNAGEKFEMFFRCLINDTENGTHSVELNDIWINNKQLQMKWPLDFEIQNKTKVKIFNFLFEVKGWINVGNSEARIVPELNMPVGKPIGYRLQNIKMNDAFDGKAYNMKAKLYVPSELPPGYKERFVISLESTDGIGFSIYGEFLNETEGQMSISYMGGDDYFKRMELPSDATIVPFHDFTVCFVINTTNGVNPAESKWIQMSVNDKYSESFELYRKVSKFNSLYIISVIDNGTGNVDDDIFARLKDGLPIAVGHLVLLEKPEVK